MIEDQALLREGVKIRRQIASAEPIRTPGVDYDQEHVGLGGLFCAAREEGGQGQRDGEELTHGGVGITGWKGRLIIRNVRRLLARQDPYRLESRATHHPPKTP